MFPGEARESGRAVFWLACGPGLWEDLLSGPHMLPSSDVVFFWKSKLLGFVYLTPAFTQFIIFPEGSLCCSFLYLVYYPQATGHFQLLMQLSLALLWPRRQGEELVSPVTHLFQVTSSPAPDSQKAVCVVTTWPPLPQGWWSVEGGSTLRGRLLFSAPL